MMRSLKIVFLITLISITFSFMSYWAPKIEPAFAQTYTQIRDWINSYGDPSFNDDKIKILADIQPGLGIIMQEIGRRFTAIFYAARGGNWDLANYELKELREAQEVAEITRPKRKDALISFEESFLGSEENPQEGTLQDAINKRIS